MYTGFFLNLSSNTARAQRLGRHLADLGAADRYRRFEAVNGRAVAAEHPTQLDPGNLGLWLSHEGMARAGREAGTHMHIVEDDTFFARNAIGQFDSILDYADQNLPDWDVIYTDILVVTDPLIHRAFSQAVQDHRRAGGYRLIPLKGIHFACANSLFVNKRSIEKYGGLIAGKWTLGLPVDVYIARLAQTGQLNGYVVLPFLTSITTQSDQSDIRGELDLGRKVLNVYRRAFFTEADWPSLHKEMDQLVAGMQITPLGVLYLKAVSYSLSEQFRDCPPAGPAGAIG